MLNETNALPAGTRLNEYRIERVLGAGGFGVTYKAWDTHLAVWVAIKEYFPGTWSYRGRDGVSVLPNTQGQASGIEAGRADYEWGLDRFLDEARVLARIQHPAVVRVRRYFRAHGSAYIVMDYEDGMPFSARLGEDGTLPEADLRRLLEQILPALGVVHEQGFLHRDLKPGNLYVRARDQSVLLIDFGAAREALRRSGRSVTALVTPGYSPPEQYTAGGARYGPWTDIYALGAILYRCITGQVPVEATERLLDDTLAPARQAAAGRYSPPLLEAVDRALKVRPEERYQSVAEMAAELDLAATVAPAAALPEPAVASGIDTLLPAAPAPTAAAVTTGPVRKHRLALVLAGLAALAVLLPAAVWLWRSGAEPSAVPRYIVKDGRIELNPAAGTTAADGSESAPAAPQIQDPAPRAEPGQRPPVDLIARPQPVPDPQSEQPPPPVAAADEPPLAPDTPPRAAFDIEHSLALAEQRLHAYRLADPPGDNALYYYEQVLQHDPANPAARAGLAEIPERYARLAQGALNQSRRDEARRFIEQGLALAPRHPQLRALQARLDNAERTPERAGPDGVAGAIRRFLEGGGAATGGSSAGFQNKN